MVTGVYSQASPILDRTIGVGLIQLGGTVTELLTRILLLLSRGFYY